MVKTDFVGRAIPWVELMLRDGGSSSGAEPRLASPSERPLRPGRGAGIATRRPALAPRLRGTLVILNRRFYSLLLRRMGPRGAAAGVGLHAVHHLVGVAAVPVAIAKHLVRGRG